MDDRTIAIITTCTEGSDSGQISFPAVLAQLMAVGVERYHADLCRWEKIYYLASGDSHTVACQRSAGTAATVFSAAGVEAAVRASQAQQIRYHEFCQRALAAGCVGYLVSLSGRRVVYYGRSGELHIEYFPSATN